MQIQDYVHAFQIYRNKYLPLKKREIAEVYLINQFGTLLSYNHSFTDDDKEDEFMDNYLVFKRLIDSYNIDPKYLPYWLNKQIKMYTEARRKRNIRRYHYETACEIHELASHGENVLDHIIEEDVRLVWSRFCDSLSKSDKKILKLQQQLGKKKKLKDVANKAGMSPSCLIMRRKRIKEQFERELYKLNYIN